MKISARVAAILAVVFALFCLAFAASGFMALGEITDPQVAADSKGFAWFWAFLGGVGIVFGVLSWWIGQTQNDDGP